MRSLHEADIRRNLSPVGNVDRVAPLPTGNAERDTSPGGAVPPPPVPSGENLDRLRRDALEALHTYVVAATGFHLPRSMTVFRRVVRTLDNQLAPVERAEHRPR